MNTKKKTLKKGDKAKYIGSLPCLKGYTVLVGKPIFDDNDNPTGRVEVFPWIEKEKRFSWVSSDPMIDELEPIME